VTLPLIGEATAVPASVFWKAVHSVKQSPSVTSEPARLLPMVIVSAWGAAGCVFGATAGGWHAGKVWV
jgi:hypothetical protein